MSLTVDEVAPTVPLKKWVIDIEIIYLIFSDFQKTTIVLFLAVLFLEFVVRLYELDQIGCKFFILSPLTLTFIFHFPNISQTSK